MKITLEKPPEGYESEARWGKPKKGEDYLTTTKLVTTANNNYMNYHIILAPIQTPAQRFGLEADDRFGDLGHVVKYARKYYDEAWIAKMFGIPLDAVRSMCADEGEAVTGPVDTKCEACGQEKAPPDHTAHHHGCACERHEMQRLKAENARLRALLAEVVSDHADPHSTFYNDCDHPNEMCEWCKQATKALESAQ